MCYFYALINSHMRKKESFPRFSNDYHENIEMQNNFLLMKIMLESDSGIESTFHETAEKKNSFLKFIIKNKLHLTFSNKVADLLGNPTFTDYKELDNEAFILEYKRLKKLLSSRSIKVDFKRKMSKRCKYDFIITELFEYVTDQNPELPMEFSYEFFHRDFEKEITEAVDFFMNDFFRKELREERDYGIELFKLPSKDCLRKDKFLHQIDAVYPSIYQIDNPSFTIEKIETDVDLVKSNFAGTGFCEGKVDYSAIYSDGETRRITGPFKIYFSLQFLGFLVTYYEISGLNLPAASSEIVV